MSTVAQRLNEVQERIAAAARRGGRDPAAVRLVAVAKTAEPADLRAAWEAGQRAFGHNRLQALEAHAAVLPEAEWHFLGPVQGKKARRVRELAAWIETVGETTTAARLERHARAAGNGRRCVLLQVNLTPEDGRYGCRAEELPELARFVAAREGLDCRGLMTIAPQGAAEPELRSHFVRLRTLAGEDSVSAALPAAPELSMGMTEDFEIAVEEGATLVRVGRAVFPPSADGR